MRRKSQVSFTVLVLLAPGCAYTGRPLASVLALPMLFRFLLGGMDRPTMIGRPCHSFVVWSTRLIRET